MALRHVRVSNNAVSCPLPPLLLFLHPTSRECDLSIVLLDGQTSHPRQAGDTGSRPIGTPTSKIGELHGTPTCIQQR